MTRVIPEELRCRECEPDMPGWVICDRSEGDYTEAKPVPCEYCDDGYALCRGCMEDHATVRVDGVPYCDDCAVPSL